VKQPYRPTLGEMMSQ